MYCFVGLKTHFKVALGCPRGLTHPPLFHLATDKLQPAYRPHLHRSAAITCNPDFC